MKKLKFCLPVLLLWLSLTAALWLMPQREISNAERRRLQQLPQASAASVLDGRFMSQLERFCQDQFPLRDLFRRLKAYFSYGLAHRLDNNGIYLVGGSAAQLEYPLSRSSVDRAAEKFQRIYDQYLSGLPGDPLGTVCGYYPKPDRRFLLRHRPALAAGVPDGHGGAAGAGPGGGYSGQLHPGGGGAPLLRRLLRPGGAAPDAGYHLAAEKRHPAQLHGAQF